MKNLAPGIPIHAQKYDGKKSSLLSKSSLLTVQCVSAIIPLLICNAFAPLCPYFGCITSRRAGIRCSVLLGMLYDEVEKRKVKIQ